MACHIVNDRTHNLMKDADFYKTTVVDHHEYVMEAYQDQLEKRQGDGGSSPQAGDDEDNTNIPQLMI